MEQYAKEMAKFLNLTHIEEKKSEFWADFGSIERTYRTDHTDYIRITFRYRFGAPRIDYHNGQDFASVELGMGSRIIGKDKYEYDNVWRPYQIQAWGALGLQMATTMWEQLSKRVHVPTNKFIITK